MVRIILILILGITAGCKQKQTKLNTGISKIRPVATKIIDSIPHPNSIVYKVFDGHFKFNDDSEYSITLFNLYKVKVLEKNINPVSLKIENCTPFSNRVKLGENYKLLDVTEWREHLLIHEHFFYEKDNYIIVINTINDQQLFKENKCFENNKNNIIESIRIYERDEYIKASKNPPRFSVYSNKIK